MTSLVMRSGNRNRPERALRKGEFALAFGEAARAATAGATLLAIACGRPAERYGHLDFDKNEDLAQPASSGTQACKARINGIPINGSLQFRDNRSVDDLGRATSTRIFISVRNVQFFYPVLFQRLGPTLEAASQGIGRGLNGVFEGMQVWKKDFILGSVLTWS